MPITQAHKYKAQSRAHLFLSIAYNSYSVAQGQPLHRIQADAHSPAKQVASQLAQAWPASCRLDPSRAYRHIDIEY